MASDRLPETNAAMELQLRAAGVRTLVGLELPVYAADARQMLPLVGGLATLQRTHEASAQFLAVKLRPGEPSCKPLFADLTKTQSLLVRVVRKKKKKRRSNEKDTTQQDKPRVQVELVGVVREKYVCEGMADFQYLTAPRFFPNDAESKPPAAPATTASSELTQPVADPTGNVWPLAAPLLSLKAGLRPYLSVEREEDLEMIPEVFSKVDLPLKYEFRQRSGYQPAETAKKRASTMTYLNFHDQAAAPQEPRTDRKVVLRRRSVGASDGVDERVTQLLTERLDEKPIWLRSKLLEGMDADEKRAARRIARQMCYVFVDGPWRGSWIRMGYDPRATPEAAKYQVVELRNNRELVHAKVTHPNRKRTKKFSNPNGPRISKVTQTSAGESAQSSKRRRKERFARGETRRSYLVNPDANTDPSGMMTPLASPPTRAGSTNGDHDVSEKADSDDNGSDGDHEATNDGIDQLEDAMDAISVAGGTSVSPSASAKSPKLSGDTSGGSTYEIFGVQLSSANVLFQIDEIDDEEVRAWINNFSYLESPTLLGGWYSAHLFLPLREMIRFRIAALVGRSQTELETRRLRLDSLKKQALSDYADERAGIVKKKEPKPKQRDASTPKGRSRKVSTSKTPEEAKEDEETARQQEEDELAFEESLARNHVERSGREQLALNEESAANDNTSKEQTTGSQMKVDSEGIIGDESGDQGKIPSSNPSEARGEQEAEENNGGDSESEASTDFSGGEMANDLDFSG